MKTQKKTTSKLLDDHSEKYTRNCNICDRPFVAKHRFKLFCNQCRYFSKAFQFSEWMPSVSTDAFSDR